MNEKEIKETVGDVILKASFAELLYSRVKRALAGDPRLDAFEEKIKRLEGLRDKFAHEIILVNPSEHPGEVFLSKVITKEEGSWFGRKDGERIGKLYASFCALYGEIKSGLDEIAAELVEKSLQGNNAIPGHIMGGIVLLTVTSATGTAVAREVFLASPHTVKLEIKKNEGQ